MWIGMARLSVALLLVLATACSTTQTAGKHYRIAKVDRDGYLIERLAPVEVVPDSVPGKPDDSLDQIAPKGNLAIKLVGGNIRYLEAVERPEVALFARVFIRPAGDPQNTLVWEEVFLNSEDGAQRMVMNKDSSIPRTEITLMPPVIYDDQEFLVELRLIEMDQDDNLRTHKLVNAAASAGATFRPEAAAAISVFQTVLAFMIANNPDDIEFQYDFAISSTSQPVLRKSLPWEEREEEWIAYDNVLQPRKGQYVIIKTEHPDRMNLPSSYPITATHAVRKALAETTRLATLDLANWPIFRGEGGHDFYSVLFGRPFGLPRAATMTCEFQDVDDGRRLLHTPGERRKEAESVQPEAGVAQTASEWIHRQLDLLSRKLPRNLSPEPLRLVDDDLMWEGRDGWQERWEDQTYMILNLDSPETGIDATALGQALNAKERVDQVLNLRTEQLTPEQYGEQVAAVTDSIKGFVMIKGLREKYDKLLAGAKTPEEIERIKAAYEAEKAQLAGQIRLTPETSNQALMSLDQHVSAKAERKRTSLSRIRPASSMYFKDSTVPITVAFDHPANCTFAAQLRRKGDVAFTPLEISAVSLQSPSKTRSVVTVSTDKLTTGTHELLLIDQSRPTSPAKFPIHISGTPTISKFQMDSGGAALKVDWVTGAERKVVGTNLHFVKAVDVEVIQDGKTTTLRIPRVPPELIEKPNVELKLKNTSPGTIKPERITLVMEDPALDYTVSFQ